MTKIYQTAIFGLVNQSKILKDGSDARLEVWQLNLVLLPSPQTLTKKWATKKYCTEKKAVAAVMLHNISLVG